MRFSIITITYNAEKYLKKTLESVGSQDFQDFEHLIWDGGSTDRTLEIAKSFPHVKIHQGKDLGISDAMNKGSKLAKGDFLLHLHADDFLLHPKALSFVDTCLRQHPKTKWLYGKSLIVDEKGDQLREPPFVPFNLKKLKKYNIISHPSTFISRELFFEAGGFNQKWRYCMDYDLWLRLSTLSIPYAFPAFLTAFREHKNSLSTNEPLNVTNEAFEVRKVHLKNWLEKYRSYRTWKKRKSKILS